MNHNDVAEYAIKELQRLHGVAKIILYGSVARHDERPDSDIDIAVIVEDTMRNLAYGVNNFSQIYYDAEDSVTSLFKQYGHRLHIVWYYETDYDREISLGEDTLNEVGIVKFDIYAELEDRL